MLQIKHLAVVMAVLVSAACAQVPAKPGPEASLPSSETTLTPCPSVRGNVCTMQYDPVCGVRDTGVRCVTTPCPSTELKTYGNACMACGDKAVSGFMAGACRGDKQ